MPKKQKKIGKTLSLYPNVHAKLKEAFLLNQKRLAGMGIYSVSAYADHLMNEKLIEIEAYHIKKYTPFMKKLIVGNRRIAIFDRAADCMIDMEMLDDGTIFCSHCERTDCKHVGFCYSDHEIHRKSMELNTSITEVT